ncbi:MAG: hypothetical protein ACI9YB_000318 [Halioglobus sp.]|jgi:hypothetical protein
MTNIDQNVRDAVNYLDTAVKTSIVGKDCKALVSFAEKLLTAVAHVFEQEIFSSKLPHLAKYAPRIKDWTNTCANVIKKHSNILQIIAVVTSVAAVYFAFRDIRKHERMRSSSENILNEASLLEDIRQKCKDLSGDDNALNALAVNLSARVMLETNKKYFVLEASMNEYDVRLHNNTTEEIYSLKKRHIRQIFLEEELIAEAKLSRKNSLIDTVGNVTTVAIIAIDSFLPLPGLKCGAGLISKGLALKDLKGIAAKLPLVSFISPEKSKDNYFAELSKKIPDLFVAAAA